jgi:rhamnose transport system permease protein
VRREISVLLAWGALLILLAFLAPGFFTVTNLRDVALANAPVLLIAGGMTLIIVAGQIDISVGSQFAILSVAAGIFSKTGLPMPLVLIAVGIAGGILGGINGALVSRLKIPAIVVTLAAMIVLRDALRWATGGAWIENLPESFQWFGFGQHGGEAVILIACAVIYTALAWTMHNISAARALYAVGSDGEAARLVGIPVRAALFAVFVAMGIFTALAAVLNAARFHEIQSNTGVGLELKAIAAVVVGGASITGGRGTLSGTLLGLGLLATIGPALTFLAINPYWEKAIQGAIILAAVALDTLSKKEAALAA